MIEVTLVEVFHKSGGRSYLETEIFGSSDLASAYVGEGHCRHAVHFRWSAV